MANTDEFTSALQISLWIIWGSYSVLGGAALLIYQQVGPVSDNIMAQLPSGSAAQEPLLLFITMATLFTYPLAVSRAWTIAGKERRSRRRSLSWLLFFVGPGS